jgi:hypothetical protein
MKRFLLLAGLLLAFATTVGAQEQGAAQEKPSGPRFSFQSTEYDFGNIAHKLPKVECRFAFTNDGTAPLVITKVLTSCSCVKTSYDKKPIPPGGKGEIVVTYEVNKKESGVFYKVIEVYSNSVDKRNNLIVKGNAVE